MSKESFKEFVRKNPNLINHVKKGDMDWQKFYEMYDLYGEENDVWKNYLEQEENKTKPAITSTVGFNDVITWLKSVNLDNLQEGIGNVQRVLGVFQDLTKKDKPVKETYKPRPLYKHFED